MERRDRHAVDPSTPPQPRRHAVAAPRSLFAQARSQLGVAVNEALQSSLDALNARAGVAERRNRGGQKAASRLQDAVFRDRGLNASARIGETPAKKPQITLPKRDEPSQDDAPALEPICTPTMARLLAKQGLTLRALRMFDAILRERPDPALQAEADALRAKFVEG